MENHVDDVGEALKATHVSNRKPQPPPKKPERTSIMFEKAVERNLIPKGYLEQALQNEKTILKDISHLLDQRSWMKEGWKDLQIELFLNHLASLDSNNFTHKAGVGEREGRIFSAIVEKRHYSMVHGIGRSGDLNEAQPKAAGSSLAYKLANMLVLDMIKHFVSRSAIDAFILPVATGMSLAMTLASIKSLKPKGKFVIWSRIDQKSAFKSILTAGLIPVVVEPVLKGDKLGTDIDRIQKKILKCKPESVICVLCTTSCFAPRGYDSLSQVAKLCKDMNVHHVVNNAYGVQSKMCSKEIDKANKAGRVDVFVQSTDKNLMVPVGGTIVSGFNIELLNGIKANYPGRASSGPIIDVLITMLSMGKGTYCELLNDRLACHNYLLKEMERIAKLFGERILPHDNNDISIAMTLTTFKGLEKEGEDSITKIGAMLFYRNISGARVVDPQVVANISGTKFKGWGSHCSNYPVPYLTAAASVGMKSAEVTLFGKKLESVLEDFKKRALKTQAEREKNSIEGKGDS